MPDTILNKPTLRGLLSNLPDDVLDAPLAMHSGGRDRELNELDTVQNVNAAVIFKPVPDGPTIVELFSRGEKISLIVGASDHVLAKG